MNIFIIYTLFCPEIREGGRKLKTQSYLTWRHRWNSLISDSPVFNWEQVQGLIWLLLKKLQWVQLYLLVYTAAAVWVNTFIRLSFPSSSLHPESVRGVRHLQTCSGSSSFSAIRLHTERGLRPLRSVITHVQDWFISPVGSDLLLKDQTAVLNLSNTTLTLVWNLWTSSGPGPGWSGSWWILRILGWWQDVLHLQLLTVVCVETLRSGFKKNTR